MGPGRGRDTTQDGYGALAPISSRPSLDIGHLTDDSRLTLTQTPLSSTLGEELKINTVIIFHFLTIGDVGLELENSPNYRSADHQFSIMQYAVTDVDLVF